jgi:hypothetical protein
LSQLGRHEEALSHALGALHILVDEQQELDAGLGACSCCVLRRPCV